MIEPSRSALLQTLYHWRELCGNVLRLTVLVDACAQLAGQARQLFCHLAECIVVWLEGADATTADHQLPGGSFCG
jgi:hypothetical protein